MIKKKEVLIHVHPDFKTRLKTESSVRNMSMIQYTKQLSGIVSIEEEFKNASKETKEKKFKFSF